MPGLMTKTKTTSELSLHGLQTKTGRKNMRTIPDPVLKELAALARKTEDDIDYSDIPDTSEQDWSEAVCGKFRRPLKPLTVRLDADVVEWLKSDEAKGYQTRLNQALRQEMLKALKEKRRTVSLRK